MKIEIKHRYSDSVLFAHEAEENSLKITLLMALKAGADLRGANLYGANLGGANLYGANLSDANLGGANLYGANLGGANLGGANLSGADLRGANLYGANLGGANLYGANLSDANLGGANLYGANLRGANLGGANLGEGRKLTGSRPFAQVGPIGSREDYLLAFLTTQGIYLRAGCFFGTVEEFNAKLEETHGVSEHGQEYRAALSYLDAHFKLWPADAQEEKAAA